METGGKQQEEAEQPAPTPPPLPARNPSVDVQSPPLPPRNTAAPEPDTSASSAAPSPAPPNPPAAADPPAPSPPAPNPAPAVASTTASRASSAQQAPAPLSSLPPRQQLPDDESEGEVRSPPLPARPRGDSRYSVAESPRLSPPVEHRSRRDYDMPRTPGTAPLTPGDFHMYNISEMVSVMGKKKKMPTTLGINLRTGIIMIAPEYAQDGPSMEWTADKMTHYSREGKHVFMELVKPSKSVDFHAGAKDTAEEIVTMLSELAGAVRAEGLREVIMAGTSQKPIQQKKGVALYDFMAQGDDEVTVEIGDEVIILDDTKSDEWWMVRRVRNQREGVVPSSYIEVTGVLEMAPSTAAAGLNAGKSTVAQNRLEDIRLTKEAIKAAQREEQREREKARASEVGPGLRLPERESSLPARSSGNTEGQQRSRRENGDSSRSNARSSKDIHLSELRPRPVGRCVC